MFGTFECFFKYFLRACAYEGSKDGEVGYTLYGPVVDLK